MRAGNKRSPDIGLSIDIHWSPFSAGLNSRSLHIHWKDDAAGRNRDIGQITDVRWCVNLVRYFCSIGKKIMIKRRKKKHEKIKLINDHPEA